MLPWRSRGERIGSVTLIVTKKRDQVSRLLASVTEMTLVTMVCGLFLTGPSKSKGW